MSKCIGLIAEDASDISVIRALIKKFLADSEFSTKKFVGKGCGKIKFKCGDWTSNLFRSGCDCVIVFHDLDRNCESVLRSELLKSVPPKTFPKSLIVIPVEELEAWLLTDSKAIQSAFGLAKAPKKIMDCESISSPKEHLRDLVWKLGKTRYYNTMHNARIAEHASVENLRRCKSFHPFEVFIRSL